MHPLLVYHRLSAKAPEDCLHVCPAQGGAYAAPVSRQHRALVPSISGHLDRGGGSARKDALQHAAAPGGRRPPIHDDRPPPPPPGVLRVNWLTPMPLGAVVGWHCHSRGLLWGPAAPVAPGPHSLVQPLDGGVGCVDRADGPVPNRCLLLRCFCTGQQRDLWWCCGPESLSAGVRRGRLRNMHPPPPTPH